MISFSDSFPAFLFTGHFFQQQIWKESVSVQLPLESVLSFYQLVHLCTWYDVLFYLAKLIEAEVFFESSYDPHRGFVIHLCVSFLFPSDYIYSIARRFRFVNTFFQDF